MRFGRVPVAVCIACGLLLFPAGGALADPKPTLGQAKAKLEKLNNQADKVVDQYNAATERYKKSKADYTALNDSYKKKLASVATLRSEVINMALQSYKLGGDITSMPALIGSGNPNGLLGGLAVAGQISAERADKLVAFDRENRGLKNDRDKAEKAYSSADKERDAVAKQKAEVLKLIKQQKKLLEKLGAYRVGNPNSTGVEYTGPASGSAAAVLRFAFAQIGKPYIFGGTGPGGYDCSGLTQASWRAAGVALPRTTWAQWAWGASRRVSISSLQPGDLIFSEGLGHVSIYAGNGQVVHAPQTGDVVKVVPLSQYNGRIVGAVRP